MATYNYDMARTIGVQVAMEMRAEGVALWSKRGEREIARTLALKGFVAGEETWLAMQSVAAEAYRAALTKSKVDCQNPV